MRVVVSGGSARRLEGKLHGFSRCIKVETGSSHFQVLGRFGQSYNLLLIASARFIILPS
jgi:hypothetical protein